MYQNPYSNNTSLCTSLGNLLLLTSNNQNYLPPLNKNVGFGFQSKPIEQKHKVFISYQHKNDWFYKYELSRLISNIAIDKSVCNDDIDPENQDEYIKRLINESHISDTTVLIVLLGNETHLRKFIDWEISAALNYRVGNKIAGLIGIVLPNHPGYYGGYVPSFQMPPRLWQNFASSYAQIYWWGEWFYQYSYVKNIIQTSFNSRQNSYLSLNNLPQFKRNRSTYNLTNLN